MTTKSHANPKKLWLILAGAAVLALLVVNTTGQIIYPDAGADLPDRFWDALQSVAIAAVMVERSVFVYLRGTGNEPVILGRGAAGELIKSHDVRPLAAIVAAVLGLILASAGLRILDSLMTLPVTCDPGAIAGANCVDESWQNSVRNWLFTLADIIVSAGLIAGGAKIVHPLLESVTGVLDSFKNSATGLGTGGAQFRAERYLDGSTAWVGAHAPHLPEGSPALMKSAQTYAITISRGANETGTLQFSHGGITVNSTCYWDKDNRIAAATYTRCSATRMSTKTDPQNPKLKRMGIYLPDAVSPATGAADIFIHEGSSAKWSDGCIVLPRAEMEKMWQAIMPKDGRNVVVVVKDA